MPKTVVFLCLFLLLCGLGYAQDRITAKHNEIIISGYIPDSCLKILKDEPEMVFYNNFNEWLPESKQVIPITIIDNRFTIKIRPGGEVGYFYFSAFPDHYIRSIYQDLFLVESGDSVCINIRSKNEVSFSGRGVEKLNYQHWIGEHMTLSGPTKKSDNDVQKIYAYKKETANNLVIAMDSLNMQRPLLNERTYNILKLNTVSSLTNQLLAMITAGMFACDSTYLNALKEELFFIACEQNGFAISDPYLLDNAFMYTTYLYNFNKSYTLLSSRKRRPAFLDVYGQIKKLYTGLLRDKLIALCFLDMIKKSKDASDYLPEALRLMTDSSSKYVIKQISATKAKGVKAFNFNVEGLDGKAIKLTDFKGKIVIVDTWFKGCLSCTLLTKEMEPVMQHFKNYKDVVFLSLNTDKQRKSFEEGARSGLYGGRKSIYAYTNGLGQNHPMIIHNQYVSYPNLLIVDKEGLVISANPNRPSDASARQSLIAMIESNL